MGIRGIDGHPGAARSESLRNPFPGLGLEPPHFEPIPGGGPDMSDHVETSTTGFLV
jgi:hypothetical protein